MLSQLLHAALKNVHARDKLKRVQRFQVIQRFKFKRCISTGIKANINESIRLSILIHPPDFFLGKSRYMVFETNETIEDFEKYDEGIKMAELCKRRMITENEFKSLLQEVGLSLKDFNKI